MFISLILLVSIKKRHSLVIVSAHYNEDLEWLKKSKHKVVVCDKAGSKPSSFTPDAKCTLDVNKGREPSSYLKYIVEHYDNLPERVAFIHGHEDAHHQRYPKHILQAIEDARPDLDFVSLNNLINLKMRVCETKNYLGTECGNWTAAFDNMKERWETLFKPILGFDMPEYFRFDMGAQFIVSRKAIHRHPKETYQKLLDYMLEPDDYLHGVVLEFLWQSLFTDVKNDICNRIKDCSDEGYRKFHYF